MINKLIALCLFLLLSVGARAQEVEMADQLRQDGKIWVVVLVIGVTFAGIVYYLVRLDNKISKLEKEIRK
ncbi:CcmD family protein [Larkinella soli]|uniref:CcmD family protein n=1 Tax=Larkinella soli TaxID=1770527 RepID=UPI000FFB2E90|nr:CcmD family protein [Larkinella soli]